MLVGRKVRVALLAPVTATFERLARWNTSTTLCQSKAAKCIVHLGIMGVGEEVRHVVDHS